MNDKDIKCLSDMSKAVWNMIDRSELDGVEPTDKVVDLAHKLTKEVERRANPDDEAEPQDEESK